MITRKVMSIEEHMKKEKAIMERAAAMGNLPLGYELHVLKAKK
jgi:hypothetical protein